MPLFAFAISCAWGFVTLKTEKEIGFKVNKLLIHS